MKTLFGSDLGGMKMDPPDHAGSAISAAVKPVTAALPKMLSLFKLKLTVLLGHCMISTEIGGQGCSEQSHPLPSVPADCARG